MASIDRFIIRGLLGSGTQGKVYRCKDPKLQRDVAIKLLHRPLLHHGTDSDELLHEARAMGRFVHPNVVSVFDVGEHQDKPFLVFELIKGISLDRYLKQGQVDPSMVLDIMQGILEGIAQAHQHHIVHRDLKPANILVTDTGVPKITDFGIAAMLVDGPQNADKLVGTPRYMAPEYIKSGRVQTQTDVFALGLIAYEMLAGQPAIQGNNPHQLLNAIVNRPIRPLADLVPELDERLGNIIGKALEKDPNLRFSDGQEMLTAWVEFRQAAHLLNNGDSGHSTVQFLLRRIRLKSDFPALASSISTLNKLAADGDQNSEELANIILKDHGLTNKILKVVNSAYYAAFSGNISTVSRAIVILGVNGIRAIAASLSLLDHFGDKPGMNALRDLLSESLYSGLAAREIAKSTDKGLAEEALLGTMLRRLGHILVAFYLEDEEQEIARLMDAEKLTSRQAEAQVLGTSYEQIGIAIAAEWNFPGDIRQCMQPIDELPKPGTMGKAKRLQVLANFADQSVQLLRNKKTDAAKSKLKKLIDDYATALGTDKDNIVQSLSGAKTEYTQFRVNFANERQKKRFLASLDDGQTHPKPSAVKTSTTRVDPTIRSTIPASREQLLREGLQATTLLMKKPYDDPTLLKRVLMVLQHSMHFSRIVACQQNPQNGYLEVVSSLGENHETLDRGFRFHPAGQPDLITLAMSRNADVYIKDATKTKVQANLPNWFRKLTNPGSFFVLPMLARNKPLGVIYAEYDLAYGFDENPKVLHLIKELRNQLISGLSNTHKAASQ